MVNANVSVMARVSACVLSVRGMFDSLLLVLLVLLLLVLSVDTCRG
jgi:hypothetical protein